MVIEFVELLEWTGARLLCWMRLTMLVIPGKNCLLRLLICTCVPLSRKRVKKQNQDQQHDLLIASQIRRPTGLHKHTRWKTTNIIKYSKRKFIQESLDKNQGNF